ncbi:hypothetical protein Malapachy_2566 [Malassezia pachydermatis]|uniref:Uncharacterized protein n=1 Tax=Malassezia pachydermatis TaxID=77020 RepID=A0A0M8MMP8_9BASI|nr:hypothetical protein Malapachy_2566 [Malassezia pachydermatis]KOS15586.1 hypothetical protein Malapachy_2566 [Malassezia pachydermatis]
MSLADPPDALASDTATLRNALERMGDVPAQQEATKVAIWKINGTIQSRTAAYARHKAEAETKQKESNRLRKSVVTKLAPKHSKWSSKATQAHEAATSSHQQMEASFQSLNDAKTELQRLETRRTDLVRLAIESAALQRRIDEIGDEMFPYGSEHTVLRAWVREVRIRQLFLKLIPTEVKREQRARSALNFAEKNTVTIMKILREILELSIQFGIANDNRDRLIPASLTKFSKRITPMLLRAKVLLGDFYTWIAKARMRQKFVVRAPVMELVDLSRMPDKKRNRLDQDGLVKSIESSYAQCRALQTFTQTEINLGKTRERALYKHFDELGASISAAQREVRAARAVALDVDATQLDKALAPFADKLPKDNTEVKPVAQPISADEVQRARMRLDKEMEAEAPEEDEDDAKSEMGKVAPSTVASTSTRLSLATTVTAVSMPGVDPDLFTQALHRLHTLLADLDASSRTDQDDEDLPWTMLALGF